MIGKRARQSDYHRALGGDGLRVPAVIPYANIAYGDAATVRLLDDALLPIREYRVL